MLQSSLGIVSPTSGSQQYPEIISVSYVILFVKLQVIPSYLHNNKFSFHISPENHDQHNYYAQVTKICLPTCKNLQNYGVIICK